jgi:hypothetical protein
MILEHEPIDRLPSTDSITIPMRMEAIITHDPVSPHPEDQEDQFEAFHAPGMIRIPISLSVMLPAEALQPPDAAADGDGNWTPGDMRPAGGAGRDSARRRVPLDTRQLDALLIGKSVKNRLSIGSGNSVDLTSLGRGAARGDTGPAASGHAPAATTGHRALDRALASGQKTTLDRLLP